MSGMNIDYRVLVTGSDGFIGRHLVPYLAERGFKVARTCPASSKQIKRRGNVKAYQSSEPAELESRQPTATPESKRFDEILLPCKLYAQSRRQTSILGCQGRRPNFEQSRA